MMQTVETIALKSKIAKSHPFEKMFFVFSILVSVLWIERLSLSLIVGVLSIGLTIYWCHVKGKTYWAWFAIPFFFTSFAAIPIFFEWAPRQGQEVYWHIGLLALTKTGVINGLLVISKSFAGLSLTLFLLFSTPVSDILHWLRQIRFPALLVDMFFLVYTMITNLLLIMVSVMTAQNARLGYINRKNSFRSIALLIISIFRFSIRRAEKLQIAMSSRLGDGAVLLLPDYNALKVVRLIPTILASSSITARL